MANLFGPSTLQVGSRLFGNLTSYPQRIRFNVSLLTNINCIITMTGVNYSLGTNDGRYLRALICRRYAGALSISELEGNGSRWVNTFGTGLGVLSETSDENNLVIQLHNSYSNPPAAQFTIDYESFGGGSPYTIETYTGGLYTTNNIF